MTMSRSVRDLRDIINASRLSMHNEDSPDELSSGSSANNSCEDDNGLDDLLRYIDNRPNSALGQSNFQSLPGRCMSAMSTRKCLRNGYRKRPQTANVKKKHYNNDKENNLETSISKLSVFPTKYIPVPPIGKRSSTGPSNGMAIDFSMNKERVINDENIVCFDDNDVEDMNNDEDNDAANFASSQINFEILFQYLDGTIIASWLENCNHILNFLAHLKSNNNFVDFAHFLFTQLSYTKYLGLLDLEFSIILDHFKCAFHSGFSLGKIVESDLETLAKCVIKEYPTKLKDHDCGRKLLLDIILTFCYGKRGAYHELLKDVDCQSCDKKSVQWLLAIRAFGLLSFITGILKFYGSVMNVDVFTDKKTFKEGKLHFDINDFVIQAVQCDYLHVLNYFYINHKVDFTSILDNKKRNLVSVASSGRNYNALNYLLTLKVSAEGRSENGNTPLQHAVIYDDTKLASLLLEHGVDVNAWNEEADGATALHMAVLLGSLEMVRLLLEHGASKSALMGVPARTTALSLAEDMNLTEIIDLLQQPT